AQIGLRLRTCTSWRRTTPSSSAASTARSSGSPGVGSCAAARLPRAAITARSSSNGPSPRCCTSCLQAPAPLRGTRTLPGVRHWAAAALGDLHHAAAHAGPIRRARGLEGRMRLLNVDPHGRARIELLHLEVRREPGGPLRAHASGGSTGDRPGWRARRPWLALWTRQTPIVARSSAKYLGRVPTVYPSPLQNPLLPLGSYEARTAQNPWSGAGFTRARAADAAAGCAPGSA